jgi:hypothetical protein
MRGLCYNHRAIGRVEVLAAMFGISVRHLIWLCRHVDRMYSPGAKSLKSDNTVRETWNAHPLLKHVQGRIKTLILAKVDFPEYLQGGLPGCDYKKNAALHKKSRILVTEDIKQFFPSVSEKAVKDIWIHFFHYPEPVAECLTRLTTRRGELPQGARTSSHLANLALWRSEDQLVQKLKNRGMRYSRLVDDISVSTRRRVVPAEKTFMVSAILGTLSRHGYRPKRSKHTLGTRATSLTVTKLLVNNVPALPKEKRKAIRAAVYQFELQAAEFQSPIERDHALRVVTGHVATLNRFHKKPGAELMHRLALVKTALTRSP